MQVESVCASVSLGIGEWSVAWLVLEIERLAVWMLKRVFGNWAAGLWGSRGGGPSQILVSNVVRRQEA